VGRFVLDISYSHHYHGVKIVRYDVDLDRWSEARRAGFPDWKIGARCILPTVDEVMFCEEGTFAHCARYNPERDEWRPAAAPPPAPPGGLLRNAGLSATPYGNVMSGYGPIDGNDLTSWMPPVLYDVRRDVWQPLEWQRGVPPQHTTRTEIVPWGFYKARIDSSFRPSFGAEERWWLDDEHLGWVRDTLVGRPQERGEWTADAGEEWKFGRYDGEDRRGGLVSVERVFRDRDVVQYCSVLPGVGPSQPRDSFGFGHCLLMWDGARGTQRSGGRICCRDEASQWSCAPTPPDPEALHRRGGYETWTGEELVVWGGRRVVPEYELPSGARTSFQPIEGGYILRPEPIAPGTGVPMFPCDDRGAPIDAGLP